MTAAVITAITAAAAKGVKRPSAISAPPRNSARAGRPRVEPAGLEADAVEHPGGALQAAAAEDAEELLGAMADEEQSHHQTKNEQCEVHVDIS